MKLIALSGGLNATVDDDDYEHLNEYNWTADKCGTNTHYAVRTIKAKGTKKIVQRTLRMHRVVLGLIDRSLCVDHVNGNGLDNRKENLRICTMLENSKNKNYTQANNTTGYRGIYKDSRPLNKPWRARIQAEGKIKCLGYYKTPEEAALAFDKGAIKYYGTFCGKLNFENKL